VTGEQGGRGVRAGVSIADITAGMYAAFGILTAVHARQATGRGQFIDVSMLEGQLGILSGMIGASSPTASCRNRSARRTGRCSRQTFSTKTRDIAIGVGSDKLWHVLPAARARGAHRRPALRDQRGAQREPGAHRGASGSVSPEDI
jgi:crotonobetainyl-CoA:carnitine CoA-transferase CaiB-like acyl-CoA transferase